MPQAVGALSKAFASLMFFDKLNELSSSELRSVEPLLRLLRQLGLSVTGQVAQRYRAALAALEKQQHGEPPALGNGVHAAAIQAPHSSDDVSR